MVDIEAKIKQWQQKLLDLGKRNANLNFKFNKTSTLKIETPEIYDLWDSLVVHENAQSFGKESTQSINSFSLEVDEEETLDDIPVWQKPDLTTNQKGAQLFKILRNLKKKTKTFKEEQGIDVLFACFGFLHYSEGRDTYDAPLVLVPVTIENEGPFDAYKLCVLEEDIVINPTLCYKLENDFGIQLPEFADEDNLENYIEDVRGIVSKNYWEILDTVGLGILSFNKINMYRDLLKHAAEIAASGLIRTIGGDSSVELPEPPDTSEIEKHEDMKPENCFQVVDADSSQQEAILCAKKGVSFVLQGPPGTGKSQTITNIIAECLGVGKKVLFVSEKMAALEVVHKRLKDANLDDFCLIMHSHKANKKSVMKQFETVLKLADKKTTVSSDALETLARLEEKRTELNAYAEAINTKISPLDMTIFGVNAELAKLADSKDLIFGISDVRNKTSQDLYGMHRLVNRYSQCLKNAGGDLQNNPWYGSNIKIVSHEFNQNIGVYLGRLIDKLKRFEEEKLVIKKSLNYDYEDNVSGIKQAKQVLEKAIDSVVIPSSWILGRDLEPLNDEIVACNETKSKFIEIRNRVIDLHLKLKNADSSLDFTDYCVLSNTDFINAHRKYLGKVISEDKLYKCFENESSIDAIDRLFAELKGNVTTYNDIRNGLLSVFDKEIFEIPFNDILYRFKTEYSWGFLNFLKSSYRADKKVFKGLCKTVGKSFSDGEIITTLNKLKTLEDTLFNIKSKESLMRNVFGDYYKCEETDVNLISLKLSIYKYILQVNQELDRLEEVVKANEAQEVALKEHYENLYAGIETDWGLVRKALDWAESFKTIFKDTRGNEVFVRNLCAGNISKDAITKALNSVSMWIDDADDDLEWLKDKFENPEFIDEKHIKVFGGWLKDCAENIAALELWIDYRDIKVECKNNGLEDFVNTV